MGLDPVVRLVRSTCGSGFLAGDQYACPPSICGLLVYGQVFGVSCHIGAIHVAYLGRVFRACGYLLTGRGCRARDTMTPCVHVGAWQGCPGLSGTSGMIDLYACLCLGTCILASAPDRFAPFMSRRQRGQHRGGSPGVCWNDGMPGQGPHVMNSLGSHPGMA